MRHDFDAIPDAVPRGETGSILARIHRDIGLAAVARGLGLTTGEFAPDLAWSIARGEAFLASLVRANAKVDLAA